MLYQTLAKDRNSIWVSYMGFRAPRTGAIFHCFSMCIRQELNLKERSWDLNCPSSQDTQHQMWQRLSFLCYMLAWQLVLTFKNLEWFHRKEMKPGCLKQFINATQGKGSQMPEGEKRFLKFKIQPNFSSSRQTHSKN